MAFAWIYDITPEGIRRTAAADSPEARTEHANRQIGRKLNTLMIAVLVLAVALLGWRVLVLRHAPTPSVAQAAATCSRDEVQRNPGTSTPDSAAAVAASGLHNTSANAISL